MREAPVVPQVHRAELLYIADCGSFTFYFRSKIREADLGGLFTSPSRHLARTIADALKSLPGELQRAILGGGLLGGCRSDRSDRKSVV